MFLVFNKPQESQYQKNMKAAQKIMKLALPFIKKLIKELNGKYIKGHNKPIKVEWHFNDYDFVKAVLIIQYPPYEVYGREPVYASKFYFKAANNNVDDLSVDSIEYGFLNDYGNPDCDYKDYYAKYKKLKDIDIEQIRLLINQKIQECAAV